MLSHRVQGQENIVAPGLYLPNRLNLQACKTLHYLLQGRLCYLVEDHFPPTPEIAAYLQERDIHTLRFDVHNTPLDSLYNSICRMLDKGQSVIFLPGQVAKIRGPLADVPGYFLNRLGELNLPIVPLFIGYYGDTIDTIYRDMPDNAQRREEFRILPRLAPGAHMPARILNAWQEMGAELFAQQPFLNTSLTTHLVHAMRKHPTTKVIDGLSGVEVSYCKLLGLAMAMAGSLRKLGESRIGVILPPGPGGIIATLACMLAGVSPVMINYTSSLEAFRSTTEQAGLRTFISANAFMAKLPNFPWPPKEQMIMVDDYLKSISPLKALGYILLARVAPAGMLCRLFRTHARSGEDEALMLFTAGSTNTPKAVAYSHRMLLANLSQCACRLSLDDERFLGSLPLFHSFGITVTMLLPLLKARPICTYPNPTDTRTLCELIEKYELTLLCATPTFARAMLRRAEAYTFATVRYFIVGAERLPAELEKEFLVRCGVHLLEGYGMTEASPVCAVNLPDVSPLPDSAHILPGTVSRSIGTLLPGLAVRITDPNDDDTPLPLSEIGMLWFKGANIFRGYVGKPEFNGSVFKDGWFKSGDLGRMDSDGFITLSGRLSRFSKIGGEMVPHEGVENALISILNLSADDDPLIAITGVADDIKGETLALITAIPEHSAPEKHKDILMNLRMELTQRGFPNLWAPRFLVPVEKIPMLPTGKQDLRACRDLAKAKLEDAD